MILEAGEVRRSASDVEAWAHGLWRRMSLERAARMCGVSAGQVARWRDGAPLTERMLRAVAIGMVADEAGLVGTFGRIDSGSGELSARVAGDMVVVSLRRPAHRGQIGHVWVKGRCVCGAESEGIDIDE